MVIYGLLSDGLLSGLVIIDIIFKRVVVITGNVHVNFTSDLWPLQYYHGICDSGQSIH